MLKFIANLNSLIKLLIIPQGNLLLCDISLFDMKFSTDTVMTRILDELFNIYAKRVPDVKKITNAMIERGMVSIKMK